MLALARVRQGISIPSVLTLSCVFLAACTTQQALHPYQYKTAHSDDIHITTKSGQEYELKAPWTSDPTGNISGKGRVLVDDEWKPFEGNISLMEIEEVSVSKFNASSPAMISGIMLATAALAVAIGLVIWVAEGKPLH